MTASTRYSEARKLRPQRADMTHALAGWTARRATTTGPVQHTGARGSGGRAQRSRAGSTGDIVWAVVAAMILLKLLLFGL